MEERRRRSHSPVPTIVHTLVSPMSTCQRAPEDADESFAEPRRPEPAEPAEVGRRLPFWEAGFEMPPVLDDPRLAFFTRPPSFDGNSVASGDVGVLLMLPDPK